MKCFLSYLETCFHSAMGGFILVAYNDYVGITILSVPALGLGLAQQASSSEKTQSPTT